MRTLLHLRVQVISRTRADAAECIGALILFPWRGAARPAPRGVGDVAAPTSMHNQSRYSCTSKLTAGPRAGVVPRGVGIVRGRQANLHLRHWRRLGDSADRSRALLSFTVGAGDPRHTRRRPRCRPTSLTPLPAAVACTPIPHLQWRAPGGQFRSMHGEPTMGRVTGPVSHHGAHCGLPWRAGQATARLTVSNFARAAAVRSFDRGAASGGRRRGTHTRPQLRYLQRKGSP